MQGLKWLECKIEMWLLSTQEGNESVDTDEVEVREERTAVTISDIKHKEENPELVLEKSDDVKHFSTFKHLL